jgi:carbohydrate-selective porin OprB
MKKSGPSGSAGCEFEQREIQQLWFISSSQNIKTEEKNNTELSQVIYLYYILNETIVNHPQVDHFHGMLSQ